MFIDTRQISDGKALIVTVCVIGGGVAGAAVSRFVGWRRIDCARSVATLRRSPITVVVLMRGFLARSTDGAGGNGRDA